MSDDGLRARFLRWLDSEEAEWPEQPESPPDMARQLFTEYLEHIETGDHMEFDDYLRMRREALGLKEPQRPDRADESEPEPEEKPLQPRLGWLMRTYRVLAVAVVLVVAGALVSVALSLPTFGDPTAPPVSGAGRRYLEQGVEETGALNAVAGVILDYRAFDTFGESTVLFAAAMSVVVLLHRERGRGRDERCDPILAQVGRIILPYILLFGIYVVVNGHLSPGGGFSGGAILGAGLILCALVLGQSRMDVLLPPRHLTATTVVCLLAYGGMKGFSFFTGANHLGPEIPKGTPGEIFSGGLILPLNLCVGAIVACTMYTFYILFAQKEE